MLFDSRVLSRKEFDVRTGALYNALLRASIRAVGATCGPDLLQDALCTAWRLRVRFNSKDDDVCLYRWIRAMIRFLAADFF